MKRSAMNDYEEIPKRKQKTDDFTDDDFSITNDQPEQFPSSKEKEYIERLYDEKSELDQSTHSNAIRLLDQEITKVQSSGRIPPREYKYINIYREKPIKLNTKVLVPVQDHPKFNFVGKLLGPKGNTLKRLQEETMCKMSILGRGSMRDPQKEQELKNGPDPKYSHLMEDLHVDITAYGPPAEAYARMAFALAEIRKYLIPDKNDSIRQEQLRELESLNGPLPHRDDHRESEYPHRGPLHPPPMMRTATRAPVMPTRVMPAKAKIMSILDKARVALAESYSNKEPVYGQRQYGGFEDSNRKSYRYEEQDYSQSYYRRGSAPRYNDATSQPRRLGSGGQFQTSSYSRNYQGNY